MPSAAPVTALYAGLLAFLFVALSARVIRARRSARIAIGVAGQPALERRARVHANFAEYAPLSLLLMLLAELTGYPGWAMHVAGIVLLGGRSVHALGVSREPEDFRLRVGGMVATLTVIVALGAMLLAAPLLR